MYPRFIIKGDNNMSVSMIADIVTILAFVSGVGLATKASVSKRSEEWIRSLIINCLDDYFGDDSNTGKPADGNGNLGKDSNTRKSTNRGRKNVGRSRGSKSDS